MRFSLRTKIQVLFMLVVFALGAVALGTFSLLASRAVAQRFQDDARETSAVLAAFIDQRSRDLVVQAKLVTELPLLKSVVFNSQIADRETIQERAAAYASQLGADGSCIADQDGRELASEGYQPLRPPPGIERTLRTGRPSTEIVQSRRGLLLSVTVPIMVGDYPKGTLSAYQQIGDEIAASLHRSSGVHIAFVQDGLVVASSLDSLKGTHWPMTDTHNLTVDGTQLAGVFSPFGAAMSKSGSGFVALRDVDGVTATYREFAYSFLGIVLIALALALVLSGTFARSVVRPLDGVVSAAAILQRGEWPPPFEQLRADELGILQGAFNAMTRSLRDSRERLESMIDIDPLTNLVNHRRFRELLELDVARAHEEETPLSVIMIGADDIGVLNQTMGHQEGDRVLKNAAEVLRPVGLASRYSGSHFALILPGKSLDEAFALAERLVVECEKSSDGVQTFSAGCATLGPGTSRAEALVLAAELAMSRAHHVGRCSVSRFDSIPGADANADPFELHRFLRDASLATIQALAAAVDAKDPYTQGHSQRVANYASSLVRHLGGSEEEAQLVFRTATLHDVGKIGVPDAILAKPGGLTDEERETIQTHPLLGELIVKKAPQLQDTLPGVRHHHERWDGKGYPDGLAGEEIPRMARILALADAFDAMTSDRPYRKGLSWDVAIEEIRKGAGIQFDPDLALAFVEMMRHWSYLEAAA